MKHLLGKKLRQRLRSVLTLLRTSILAQLCACLLLLCTAAAFSVTLHTHYGRQAHKRALTESHPGQVNKTARRFEQEVKLSPRLVSLHPAPSIHEYSWVDALAQPHNGSVAVAANASVLTEDCLIEHADAATNSNIVFNDPDCPPVTCEDLLGGIPKVALLFLTKGDMPHAWLWRDWLSEVVGKLPVEAVKALLCNAPIESQASLLAALQARCLPSPVAATVVGRDWSQEEESVIDRQYLFSVYVHAPPSMPDYQPGDVFYNRLVRDRVVARWGSHELIEATRNLLAAALQLPANQRFVLLSETTIPLYPPQLIYLQALAEPLSRIDACGKESTSLHRHIPDMAAAGLPHTKWRKSWQWFMLTRRHAQLGAEDTRVADIFRRFCYEGAGYERRRTECYSDEHYLPTLLAMHGLEAETSCSRSITYVDWGAGGAHPKSFSLRILRLPHRRCKFNLAIKRAHAAFVALPTQAAGVHGAHGTSQHQTASSNVSGYCAAVSRLHGSAGPVMGPFQPLETHCPLFARKFPGYTAVTLHRLLHNCTAFLNIVDQDKCIEEKPDPAVQVQLTAAALREGRQQDREAAERAAERRARQEAAKAAARAARAERLQQDSAGEPAAAPS